MRLVSMTLGAHLFLSVAGLAGPPLIENADLEVVSSQSSLGSQVETWTQTVQGTAWLGWHVPMVDRDQVLCCQNQACSLESTHRHFVFSSARSGSPRGAENLVVLLRANDGQLEEMQIYSDGCRLDAGGRNVIWLEGVQPEESVTFLDRLIEADPKIEDEALMAMALHATPTAAERLAGMARQSPDPDLRGEALFWLSHTGASTASEVILLALAEDPDAEVASFIDGRFELDAHGTREMPVWGRRLAEPIAAGTEGDEVARGRIQILVEYLKTIQQPTP